MGIQCPPFIHGTYQQGAPIGYAIPCVSCPEHGFVGDLDGERKLGPWFQSKGHASPMPSGIRPHPPGIQNKGRRRRQLLLRACNTFLASVFLGAIVGYLGPNATVLPWRPDAMFRQPSPRCAWDQPIEYPSAPHHPKEGCVLLTLKEYPTLGGKKHARIAMLVYPLIDRTIIPVFVLVKGRPLPFMRF
jgi:hypothetical protein